MLFLGWLLSGVRSWVLLLQVPAVLAERSLHAVLNGLFMHVGVAPAHHTQTRRLDAEHFPTTNEWLQSLHACRHTMFLADCAGPSRAADGTVVLPEAQWPGGISSWNDYLHSKGMQAGFYTDYGVSSCTCSVAVVAVVGVGGACYWVLGAGCWVLGAGCVILGLSAWLFLFTTSIQLSRSSLLHSNAG
jgi:hypothetical protein